MALCAQAGLVSLGRVALDGTKVRASASRHRAMSYDRMVRAEAEPAAEVDRLVADAERIDAVEDAAYGPDRRGDELPAELRRRTDRLAVIRKAKAALEAEHGAVQAAERAATERGEESIEVAAAGDAAEHAAVVPKQGATFVHRRGRADHEDLGRVVPLLLQRPAPVGTRATCVAGHG